MRTIMKKMPEVRYKFHKGVDRDFRDIREYLERKEFVVKIPDIIPPDESQLINRYSW